MMVVWLLLRRKKEAGGRRKKGRGILDFSHDLLFTDGKYYGTKFVT
jgi:hypothetical protein